MSVLIDYTSGAFVTNKNKGVGSVTDSGIAGFNISAASYDEVSFNFNAQENQSTDIFFKPDGTVLYVLGETGDAVYQYSLSTAWDVSTASYVQTFSVASEETNPRGLFFKPDGTKMYITGISGDDVNEYNLSTAWDISTASYVQRFSVNSQETAPGAIFFKPDGTKMYVSGQSGDDVNEYNLSTAWDISTASYVQNFSVMEPAPSGLYFTENGTHMFLLGSSNDKVLNYYLSTPWDVSTAKFFQSFSVFSQSTIPVGLHFKPDGTKMYIVDVLNDTVYQYSLGTAQKNIDLSSGQYFEFTPTADTTFAFSNPPTSGTAAGFALALTGANATVGYDLANASYDSVSFSVAGQDANPSGPQFSLDMTKMYVLGASNDAIYQYSLSVAGDVSTASYDSVSFSVASQDVTPRDFQFNADGTKLYYLGYAGTSIYQYSLSTAWDLSTASYDSVSFNVSTQETNPSGFAFGSNGTIIVLVGLTQDTVFEYSLSTAYDLSTMSYSGNSFDPTTQLSSPHHLSFNGDGTKLFISSYSGNNIYQYSLSTPYSLSSVSYDSVTFSFATQGTNTYGHSWGLNGQKLYTAARSVDTIYQYSTSGASAPATIAYPASVDWPSGTPPSTPAVGETDVLVFYTDDGGNSYKGFKAGEAMS